MPPTQRWDGRRYQAPRRPIPIIDPLREVLFDTPGLTCDALVEALNNRGVGTTVGDVLTVLHRQQGTFIGQSRHSPWDLTVGARQRVAQLRSQPPRRQPDRPRPKSATTSSLPPAAVTTSPKAPRVIPSLVVVIQAVLAKEPNLAAREIANRVLQRGLFADRRAVNSELYRHRGRLFQNDGSERPLWRNVGHAPAPVARPAQPTPRPAAAAQPNPPLPPFPQTIPLYAWQRQALDAWEAEGRRGIVEAVTGTGKTRVGMMAIRESLADGGFVHVLVPTIDLQDQWCRELETLFPGVRVGRRGNDRADSFPQFRLIVSVVNSARDYAVGTLPGNSLLVADECHRYGADGNARALREAFTRRLGLTATFARDDGGCEAFLAPYFGETCFQMGYAQAIEDEVTAHFKVALVGVDFGSETERHEYDLAADQGGKARQWLISKNWAPAEPFGEFMKHVAQLAANHALSQGAGDLYTAIAKARAYMQSFSTRRTLLACTTSKQDALEELLDAIHEATRTIVFTESIESASAAAALLRNQGISAAAIHSKMRKPERKAILGQFARGQLAAIAAPKVLDEGIDVPAADLAIIFATSKTRRQMVQRMGRVLRRKPDGRLARFIVLYVERTTEDPATGAHESFIGEITDPGVAEDVRTFDSSAPLDAILAFLNDFSVPNGQPAPRMAQQESGSD
jgi:superfamily II DNA or RNA helicase